MDVRHTHYTCAIVSVSLSDVVASIEWVSNSDGVASLEWVQIIDVVVAIVLVANSDVVALFEWVQLIDVVVAIVCVCPSSTWSFRSSWFKSRTWHIRCVRCLYIIASYVTAAAGGQDVRNLLA